jgi:hypothetical protein
LAAIILASLGTARSKGNDAKIEEQLKNIQSAAAIYESAEGNYGTDNVAGDNICTLATDPSNSGIITLMTASSWPDGNAPSCNTDATGSSAATVYVMYHPLSSNSSEYFCVDSTGVSRTETAAPSGSPTACW